MKAELNEQTLLKGLANNDSKAIEIIYKQNFNSIQSMVINNNGFYDDARDIFQEALIALYEKSITDSFVLTCKINTYLFSVSKRLWLKKLQQNGKYISSFEILDEVISVDTDMEIHQKRNVEFEIMERSMESIGEPCKSLLEAYYIKKLDMQKIATEFNYTNADNAKNQKYKCLLRLKKIFFAQYNIGE